VKLILFFIEKSIMTEKTSVGIRQYTPLDYAKVREIWKVTGLLRSGDESRILQILEKTRHFLLLLVEVDGSVVGVVGAFYIGRVGYVYHLGVHPNFQRRGIGSLLLSEVCRKLRERNVHLTILFIPFISNLEKDSERSRFYRRNGFTTIRKMFVKKL